MSFANPGHLHGGAALVHNDSLGVRLDHFGDELVGKTRQSANGVNNNRDICSRSEGILHVVPIVVFALPTAWGSISICGSEADMDTHTRC